jgi:hypothetical protein
MLRTFVKLRKDYLTGIGHGAVVLTKRLHFLIFPIAKGGTKKIIEHLPLLRG